MQCPTVGCSTAPAASLFYRFYSIACAVPWSPTIFNGKCSIDEFDLNNISFLNFNSASYPTWRYYGQGWQSSTKRGIKPTVTVRQSAIHYSPFNFKNSSFTNVRDRLRRRTTSGGGWIRHGLTCCLVSVGSQGRTGVGGHNIPFNRPISVIFSGWHRVPHDCQCIVSRHLPCRVHTWFPSSPNSSQSDPFFYPKQRHISLIYAISVSQLSSTIITLATRSFYLFYSTGWLVLYPLIAQLVGIHTIIIIPISDWSSSISSEDKRQT